jgi:hypothetical protein
MMNKPAAFIMVEGGRTWFRTSAETEEAIRTGFIMETVPLYTAPPKQEPLSLEELCKLYGDNVVEDIFTFARAIEKAHGIGGGE